MTSTSLTSVFPQELIDLVITENADDEPTLMSCALVCSTFRRPSQAQIFYHVDCVLTPPGIGCFHRLRALLHRSPYLSDHIRSLKITGSGEVIEDASFLKSISNLRALELTNIPLRPLLLHVKTAIHELCASSKLRELSIENARPLNLQELSRFITSAGLNHLLLDISGLEGGIENIDEEDDQPVASEGENGGVNRSDSEMRLNILDVDMAPDIIVPWLLSKRECLSQLEDISVQWYGEPETIIHLQRLFDASEIVQRLDLFLPLKRIPRPLRSVTLAKMTSLKHLSLNVSFDNCEDLGERFVRWLSELLQSQGKASGLTNIQIDIEADPPEKLSLLAGPGDWNQLAELLSIERFPVLQKIKLVFSVSSMLDTPGLLYPIYRDSQRAFSGLQAEGILDLQVELNADSF
ncbi:hypothetical protein C8R43DRAFT_1102064 [Mycena crocata]|nr:hypothetical protein C8R43DRAFT_1102064 [Mycena crocata]